MARVAVDVPALADQGRQFDYSVPARFADMVRIGTIVRVPLHGRRVGGWIVELDVEPPAGVRVQALTGVTGHGPQPDLVELSEWAAWRWSGRRTSMLRAASPTGAVRHLPPPPDHGPPPGLPGEWAPVAREALSRARAVVRLPPAADPMELVGEIAQQRPTLVITPGVDSARATATGLHRVGVPVALLPDGWARAAAGGRSVVGARGAAWGPAPGIGAVIVVDSHDGALVEERAPTWSAWVVAAERARRLEVPCVLLSACPPVEQLAWGHLVVPSRAMEREGWSAMDVVDRRGADPRSGLLDERLVAALRSARADRRTVVVLNRKGRVRLLSCRSCRSLVLCEHCDASMEELVDEGLTCRRCGRSRPRLCQQCGSGALRAVRSGVTRVGEELAALARMAVGEVTADVGPLPPEPLLIGTEAVLNRFPAGGATGVGCVVFLDFDAELLAPRFRAGEEALALLARAARLVGGRSGRGTVVVQTRLPDHPVIQAALRADPGRIVADELALREELRLPPAAALAELSGDPARTAALASALQGVPGVEVMGPTDGRWLVRASDHDVLCDALSVAGRPSGAEGSRLRVDVDPLRA